MSTTNKLEVTKQELPPLIKQSATYKLIVPRKVEEKIRYLIRKYPHTEWSGVLFYTHTGSFEDNNLVVTCEEISLEDAQKSGATGLFVNKYGDKVKVYTIGDFSKEICGGPHVEHTGTLGHFRIVKEEAVSAGVRRIKAILE
jgi:hypothetical protein